MTNHTFLRASLSTLLLVASGTSALAQAPAPDAPAPPPEVAPAPPPDVAPPPAPAATVQPAAELQVTTEPADHRRILLSAKVGGIVPFDGLSPFVSVGVELGFVLPVAGRHLAIVLDVDYTQPTTTGSEQDPRVMGGTYTWKLTEQELGIMPVLLYRLTAMKPVIPYAGIGPRILLARSTVRDNGTPAIMETHEQSTRLGVAVPIGAELPLGPGHAIGELLLQYGTLNHVATGDANTGAISLSVGYRLLF